MSRMMPSKSAINNAMRIYEIMLIPPRDENPEQYQYHFQKIDHVEKLSTGLILKVSGDAHQMHIGVFDDIKLISYVGLHRQDSYWQVDMQCTDHDHRAQGYIRKSIEYAIRNHHPVISDTRQTPEARQVWTALIKYPNTINYGMLDTSTNISVPIKWDHQQNILVPDPWDDTEDTVIIAIPKPISESTAAMQKRRAELDRMRNRRDPWLGEGFTDFNP